MKYIVLFFFTAAICAFAGIAVNSNRFVITQAEFEGYEKAWEAVDKLDEKGLPESAYTKVKEILAFAREEQNEIQTLKAITYSCKYIAILEEDGQVMAITFLENEISNAHSTAKNILQSMLAEMYQNYFQQNMWRFYNRTNLETQGNDIRTWDLKTLAEKTSNLFLSSLSNADLLQKTALIPYEPILINGDVESKMLRPTLYDLLAHRAFDYFANNETYISQPAYVFTIDDPTYLADNKFFAAMQISAQDSAADKLFALQLMQELIRFHLKDPDPAALIQADIKRLQFVKQNAVFPYKDSLYINALIQAEKKYILHPASSAYSYEIAAQLYNQSNTYNPFTHTEVQMDAARALRICDSVIARYPKTYGGENCAELRDQILQKDINLTTEKYNVPDIPFRALIEWKNVETAHMQLVKLSADQLEDFNNANYNDKVKFIAKIKPVKEWEQELPQTGDYQSHSAEIKIDGLSSGIYVLAGSTVNKITDKTSITALAIFNVTHISYVSSLHTTGGNTYYFLDRSKGTPLVNAEAQTYRQVYDKKSKKYVFQPGEKYIADNKGAIYIAPDEAANNYLKMDVRYKGDTLYNDQYLYIQREKDRYETSTINTYFFTDRSIYRPGQVIYFKGIMIETTGSGRTKNIVANRNTEVTFYDANMQIISTVKLVTNDYGSFSGSFFAPQSGLTGEMSLRNETGLQSISVEEYKRPTFFVETEKLTGSYALNDTIHLKGKAQSYSGAVIDNALVKYRVVREAVFPWPVPYYYKYIYQRSTVMEITNGETFTNASGNFEIAFAAIPDRSIDPEVLPQFNYTIITDVTDISGETRSNSTNVNIGYIGITADMQMPAQTSKDSAFTISIQTNNLNNSPVSAEGTITIYPLTSPEKLFRNRLWQQPDMYTMTQAEYNALFPTDLYADENNMEKWQFGKSVQRIDFNTAKSSELKIRPQEWKSGAYKIILTTKDANGREIKVEKFITITDKKNREPVKQYLRSIESTLIAKPGEQVKLHLNSDANDARVLLVISRPGNKVTYEWFSLNTKFNFFTIPVLAGDVGGINIAAYMVKDNRLHQINWRIDVPWDEKELSVSLETHRNMLEPGSSETWKIKITGPKGDAVAAELLAAMYDKSLDAFKPHNWSFINWPYNYEYASISDNTMFSTAQAMVIHPDTYNYPEIKYYNYDQLNWFGYNFYYGMYGDGRNLEEVMIVQSSDNKRRKSDKSNAPPMEMQDGDYTLSDTSTENAVNDYTPDEKLENVPLRKNFNETAFFYPQLETDSSGTVVFSFTMPEALTEWKFSALAHTVDLLSGFTYSSVITQKELMITPNMPRFFRTGDTIYISAKIQNLTDSLQEGVAQLELQDALSLQNADAAFSNNNRQVSFSAAAKQSDVVTWKLIVPENIQAVQYQIKASAGKFTDGEQNVIPVLSNTLLVTETLPLWVRAGKTKDFTFDKLLNASTSSTLQHQRVTVEYTSNPAWTAVQALPYLMEYPYECAEQIFSRYYANSIATYITTAKPEIRRIFNSWNTTPDALSSDLEKNQDLKSLLIEETPWVLEAKDETERKKRIALLFDANKMQLELQTAMQKLQIMQLPDGAWPWFNGMPESRYITQHIITGIGHLMHLQVIDQTDYAINRITTPAIGYLDAEMLKDYKELEKFNTDRKTYHPSNLMIHYLYGRSFFDVMPMPGDNYITARNYFTGQLKKYWNDYDLYSKGLIALILNRTGDTQTAKEITASLKEYAIKKDEMGMYWKNNTAGYYWYQSPIETQALMIEVFNEVANDDPAVEELKIWLLRNKQTNDWKTTKATAEACYALLLTGDDLLASTEMAVLTVGGLRLQPGTTEAGTGYFSETWTANAIKESMGNIQVTGPQTGFSYGAMYWQYFEQMDKITPAATPLHIVKKLYRQKITATGIQLEEISEQTALHIGDLVQVRIELRSDREMEYIHLKDMRAACFEPVNVLTAYKWQDGLGYVESTRDAATHFFIERLPQGTFVFEYSLRVAQNGNFSNGITTIQSMYAPEFRSHSEGIRVNVK